MNIAIDQRAKVRVEHNKSGMAIEIRSEDLDVSMRLTSIDYIDEVESGHPLELVIRLLEFFRPAGSLKITTSCMSPAGAGLGGSSALALSLCGAFNVLNGCRYSREELITIAKNVETQILKVPAGVQDYYPAMYGGLNSVMLEVLGDSLMRHSHLLTHSVESRLVLVYSGQSRNSGMNNWDVMKSYIDKDQEVQDAFQGIQDATADLELALKTGNFIQAGEAMEADMAFRQKICPGIVTDPVRDLIEFGKSEGAEAAKICGAGGGGCVAFWVNSSQKKMNLLQKLREKDHHVINFHVDAEGLAVNTN